jgi:hypothetical protein
MCLAHQVMMTRLLAVLLVLARLMAVALGRMHEAQAFLPAGVTCELDDSPVDEAATRVSWSRYTMSKVVQHDS